MELLGDDRARAGQIAKVLDMDSDAVRATLAEMERLDLGLPVIRLIDGVAYEFWRTHKGWAEIIQLDDTLAAFQAAAATTTYDCHLGILPEWNPFLLTTRDLLIVLTEGSFGGQSISNVASLLMHPVQLRPDLYTPQRYLKGVRLYVRRKRKSVSSTTGIDL
jgi:hypothetical protein